MEMGNVSPHFGYFQKRQTAALSHPAQEGPLGTPAISEPRPGPVMNRSGSAFTVISRFLHRGHTGAISSPLKVRCTKVCPQALQWHSVVGMVGYPAFRRVSAAALTTSYRSTGPMPWRSAMLRNDIEASAEMFFIFSAARSSCGSRP